MAKLPVTPDLERLATLKPALITLPVETRLWRVYFRSSPRPTQWSTFRYFGPTGSRFDHHLNDDNGRAFVQTRGIFYAACDAITCLAEVFQQTRTINRRRFAPYLVGFDTLSPLALLDLSGSFATRAGASMALMTGARRVARAWSRGFYATYPGIHGLYYPSSMHANRPAMALYQRTPDGWMPARPGAHRALVDAVTDDILVNAAETLGYRLI